VILPCFPRLVKNPPWSCRLLPWFIYSHSHVRTMGHHWLSGADSTFLSRTEDFDPTFYKRETGTSSHDVMGIFGHL